MEIYDEAMGLENLVQQSICVAQCILACQLEASLLQSSPFMPSAAPTAPPNEPMQVDFFHPKPNANDEFTTIYACTVDQVVISSQIVQFVLLDQRLVPFNFP